MMGEREKGEPGGKEGDIKQNLHNGFLYIGKKNSIIVC